MPKMNQLIAILAAVILCAGCAGTPQERLAGAERTLQAAADTTRLVVDSRALDNKPNALRAIKLANDEARNAIAKARTYVAAGATDDGDFWIAQALASIADIQSRLAASKE